MKKTEICIHTTQDLRRRWVSDLVDFGNTDDNELPESFQSSDHEAHQLSIKDKSTQIKSLKVLKYWEI